jgi:hypothetical protein
VALVIIAAVVRLSLNQTIQQEDVVMLDMFANWVQLDLYLM